MATRLANEMSDIVEDVIANGELTQQDIKFIRNHIQEEFDTDILIELLSIAQCLDYKLIHSDFQDLLTECFTFLYVINNSISNRSAKELMNLFDPDDDISPHVREALRRLKNLKYGKEFQAFLDDNMI